MATFISVVVTENSVVILEFRDASGVSVEVNVFTLYCCINPYHWFYSIGYRCFWS